ncbi:hypothetical protein P3L10_026844 [Capsicum annuum]
MVDSGLIDVEIGLKYSPASTNRLLEIRTFAGKLGENVTLSLETDTTEAMEVILHPGNLQSNFQSLRINYKAHKFGSTLFIRTKL